MKRPCLSRSVLLRSLVPLGLLLALVPGAVAAQRAWNDAAVTALESSDPAARRERAVVVDRRSLDRLEVGDQIEFELFENGTVTGDVLRHRVHRADRYTLSGTIDGVVGGSFVLSVNRDAAAGVIRLGADGLYRLESTARGPRRMPRS